MKIILILTAALSFLGLITYNITKTDTKIEPAEIKNTDESETQPAGERSPVLIELFTSEGCSSCPPADKNLIYFNEKQPFPEAQVITLSMHVDYWNRLGWTDPFSSSKYSERQEFYSNTFKLGEVYTPQMIVNGAEQFVGGNLNEAQRAISAAAKSPKAKVELSVAENKLNVKISEIPEHTLANVFVAVAEDDLSTTVKRGENGGRTLSHASVVRELRTIGTIAANDKSFETETVFQMQPSWKKQNLKIVVFAQIERTSRIIGVNQIRL
jgi:hypothetical protein